jgi:hypothetical protein
MKNTPRTLGVKRQPPPPSSLILTSSRHLHITSHLTTMQKQLGHYRTTKQLFYNRL